MDNKQTTNRPSDGSKKPDWNRQTEELPGSQTEDKTKDSQAGDSGRTGTQGDMNRNRNRPGQNQPGMGQDDTNTEDENDEENPAVI